MVFFATRVRSRTLYYAQQSCPRILATCSSTLDLMVVYFTFSSRANPGTQQSNRQKGSTATCGAPQRKSKHTPGTVPGSPEGAVYLWHKLLSCVVCGSVIDGIRLYGISWCKLLLPKLYDTASATGITK